MRILVAGAIGLAGVIALLVTLRTPDPSGSRYEIALLNVSYDPTRELYEEINRAFAADYKAKTGVNVRIEQSHGGSGKQARSIIDGLQADVATLGLGGDILALQKAGLVAPGWEKRLPGRASPYTSTIVFLVRKGNPRQISDWPDLVRPGTQVIVANPKTSGGARWAFLAAWGYAAGAKSYDLQTTEGVKNAEAAIVATKTFPALTNPAASAFTRSLYKNVPVLDTGARGSTITFAQKGIGDVLVAWENEAWLAVEEFGSDKFEIVYPSASILAEPPVAIVDQVVDAKGTRAVAEAYLNYLYTPSAQEVVAVLHYRPRDFATLQKFSASLPPIKLFTIDETFGGWVIAQKTFFSDGGVFDSIYKPASSK